MITNRVFDDLYTQVRNSRMDSRFDKAQQAAIIAAPAIIVEMIVKKAAVDSGIDMDWHYFGGRGVVYTLGDVRKSRQALMMNIPVTDLTMGDLC